MGAETEPLLAQDKKEQDLMEEWIGADFKGNMPDHLSR